MYRRIPDKPSYFAAGRPTYLAFMPRPQDHGAVSLALKSMVTEEEARTNPRDPGDTTFGLCELDVAETREMTGGVVSFWQKPAESHVQMRGCADEVTAAFIASLSRVIRPPGSQ